MFLRIKRFKGYEYVVLVENSRIGGKTRQRILQQFGRRDNFDYANFRRKMARMPNYAYWKEAVDDVTASAPRGADGQLRLTHFGARWG